MPTLAALWQTFAALWAGPSMPLTGGQLQLPGGLVIGAGTKYRIESVQGLGQPPERTFDIVRQTGDGAFPGYDLYDERTVLVKMSAIVTSPTTMPATRQEIGAAFNILTAPARCYIRLPNDSERFILAQPRGWDPVIDSLSNAGGVTLGTGRLVAPDPLIYSSTAGSLTGSGTATNGGTYPTPAVITVTGAATNPNISNGSLQIKTTLAMAGGDTLVIDVAKRTVKLNGVNRYDIIDAANTTWWRLNPGANTITYTGGGTCVTAWNDGSMAI